MKRKRPQAPHVQMCEFVSATDLVPRSWDKTFWCLISDNAPFSWGDTGRALVTASRFADHCQERLGNSLQVKRFLCKLRRLGEMYIDLES